MEIRLDRAILHTLQYADIFDYVLMRDELAHFLIGVRATDSEINDALRNLVACHACCISPEGFVTLPGRENLVAERLRLRQRGQTQKERARRYARLLGYFPFVRMIALTGALAMENARDDDIDLLIVCAPGHLWTVRGAAVALVRLARLAGDHLCPNFLITENRLDMPQDLYSAHEIVQMIPFYGQDVYRHFRHLNAWVEWYLPNAAQTELDDGQSRENRVGRLLKRVGERVLAGNLGAAIERWEMSRKIIKLSSQIPPGADDVEYSSETCRGFVSGHGRRILSEYETRVRNLAVDSETLHYVLNDSTLTLLSVGG